jgi:hypothetical protein
VPIGASKVYANGSIQFKIPAHLYGQYLSCEDSYLTFTLKNTSTVAYHLPKCGAEGMFRRINLSQGGSTISDQPEHGLWSNTQFMKYASTDALASVNQTLRGTNSTLSGATLPQNQSRTFSLPIKNHASLFRCFNTKYIPLNTKQDLDLVYELYDYKGAGYWNTNSPTVASTIKDSNLEIYDIYLNLSIVQLGASEEAKLIDLHKDGLFVFDSPQFSVNTFTVQPESELQTLVLGLGYSDLCSISFVQIPTQNMNDGEVFNTVTCDVRSNFYKNYLESFSFIQDGTPVEHLNELKANVSEVLANILTQTEELGKTNTISKAFLNYPAMTKDVVNTSTDPDHALREDDAAYIPTMNLAVMKSSRDKLCVGRNTLQSTTSLRIKYTSGQARPSVTLYVLPEFSQRITLDLSSNGDGMFHMIM